jgi:NDP-sugar pyrophosphorylase family protein
MQAVVLAGGLGTRLRPFTITIPKPLLPLGDRPIVDIILHQLRGDGFSQVCMCLGFMAPLFQAFFGDGSRYGLDIQYVIEESPLGTAGALRLVPHLNDDFLVLNGDTLTDLNYRDLLATHQRSEAYGTIFSAKVEDFIDYGLVEFEPESGRLLRYIEKPTRHYHVSTGIYALSKRILQFADLPTTQRLDMPDLLRRAAEDGRPIICYQRDLTYWRDIGRFDHYEAASKDFQLEPDRFLRNSAAATNTK